MSLKSIIFSVLAVLFMVGFLFAVVVLFGFDIVLGIIGIVVWVVVSGILWRRAVSAANGIVDKILAKYILPVLGAVLVLGVVVYISYNAITA